MLYTYACRCRNQVMLPNAHLSPSAIACIANVATTPGSRPSFSSLGKHLFRDGAFSRARGAQATKPVHAAWTNPDGCATRATSVPSRNSAMRYPPEKRPRALEKTCRSEMDEERVCDGRPSKTVQEARRTVPS